MRINEKHNICGERLRKIRKRRGLSQEDLAAKLQLRGLDLTQKAISRIETGSRLVTDYELKYLAEVLNIPVRLLLEEEDSETTDPETVPLKISFLPFRPEDSAKAQRLITRIKSSSM